MFSKNTPHNMQRNNNNNNNNNRPHNPHNPHNQYNPYNPNNTHNTNNQFSKPTININSQSQEQNQSQSQSQILTILGNTLSKISFCDKQCSNINDNKIKSQIIQLLDVKYGINPVNKDYNIISPTTLNIVSFHQHVLSPFTNGNPYLLYLTKIDNINCCIYIDKKLKDGYTFPKMHCVKYRFNDDLFTRDTILSGELVKDYNRRWLFIIDNILLYKGEPTTNKNIISKFELIHKIFNNEYKMDTYLEICPLQIKKLFLYKDINKMVNDFIPNLSYVCKGIVFYSLNNKCSNFAFLLQRESQIEIKSQQEIDDIIQEQYPNIWEKKHTNTNTNTTNTNTNTNNINIDVIGANEYATNKTDNIDNIDSIDSIDSIQPINLNLIQIIKPGNVVFKILKTDMPDIYNLYCIDDENNNLYKYANALVPNIKISHYLYNMFKNNPNNLDLKIECKYSKIFEKWTPINFINNASSNINTNSNTNTNTNTNTNINININTKSQIETIEAQNKQ